ncbi:prephenate dehydrogenase [candidate division KSB1 bacterium]
MIYNTASIIGVGLIGGSLARAFKHYKVCTRVTGISRSDAYKRARNAGIIDDGYPITELERALENADLIVLAMPIVEIIKIMRRVFAAAPYGSTITDVGSTKSAIMESALSCSTADSTFIGGHPMAGSEKTGFEAGSHDLFRKRPYVLIKPDQAPQENFDKLYTAVEKIGAIPQVIDAGTHDTIVAGISQWPQLVAIGLMNVIGRRNEVESRYYDLCGPAFLEMTRIAASDYSIWEEILSTNTKNIETFMKEFILELKKMKTSIGDSSMKEYFKSANLFRECLVEAERNR